jgi:uncharacterized protein involved in response to NO
MSKEATGLARIPVLSYGFRPFFLGAASWAALAMVLWLGVVTGVWTVAGSYGPVAWHAHELLFGYVSAVVAGFLLTAIPNWTGRLPVRGGPLLVLFLLWAAGRIALLAVDWIGLVVAMAVDALFLIVFALAILREIIVGRNWRNLKTVALVTLLAATNIGFHVEVYFDGAPDYSLRAAVAAIIGLIMLIGGRLVPSFTRNWLVRQGVARLPASLDRFDITSMLVSGAALVIWVAAPGSSWSGIALLAAGVLQALRISRWAGLPTWREPLVLVLHFGYAFVPLGFLLVGLSVLWPQAISPSGALHAWTAGAVALMTLAVMSRASLGHTGYPLTASITTCVVYAAAIVAAFSRIAASLLPDLTFDLLSLAAFSWVVAFGGFVIFYGPKLLRAPMSS